MAIKRAAEAPATYYPIKRRNLRDKTGSISEQSVVCNIDLLSQILLRLPASSAIKFRSVCKSWNSLISSRNFCLLWQLHRPPGLLIRAPFSRFESPYHRFDSHRCISLLGSNAGAIQFRMPREYVKDVLQSCYGFLLVKGADGYWIYNPATTERITLPRPLEMGNRSRRTSYRTRCGSSSETRVNILELKEGEFHPGPCCGEIKHVNFALNKSCNGRVVVLTKDEGEYIYQIYLAELGGNWRHSGQVFEYRDRLVDGVYWNNSIIWLGGDVTVCFDVDGEELRVGAAPPGTLTESFNFEESGGHLHFIQRKDSSTLVVHEMMPDLSAWFVKYSIASSQIDPTSGFGYGFHDSNLKVYTLIDLDKDSAVLVLRLGCDIVAYRIQDQKTTKICKADDFGRASICGPFYGYRRACPHIESILQFHPSSSSNLFIDNCNKKLFF